MDYLEINKINASDSNIKRAEPILDKLSNQQKAKKIEADLIKQAEIEAKEESAKKAQQEKKYKQEEIEKIIEKANYTFKLYGVSNQFELDKKNNLLIVKVLDANTKEVIRQLPPEEVIRRLEKMKEYLGLIFDEKF